MKVNEFEIQPSQNGILIFMTGQIQLEGESHALGFVRVFFLAPTQTGSIYGKFIIFIKLFSKK